MDARFYANSRCIRVGASFLEGGRGCFQFAELLQDVRSFVPLSSLLHVLRVGGVGDFITNSPSQKAKLADFDLNEFVGIFAQLFSLINFKAGL